MKTPMKELIDKLNNVKPTEFCSIETIRGWAEEMLEKEKQVIKNAHIAGFYSPPFRRSRDGEAEDYFNQKYIQNEDQYESNIHIDRPAGDQTPS